MSTDIIDTLAERILAELRATPNQKASEISQALGVERRDVTHCLSHVLAGKVAQDASYRWRLREAASSGTPSREPRTPASDLNRLCRYYLECIGQDSDQGVSTFAASQYGEPDYAELRAMPQLVSQLDWWNEPGVGRVLAKVRADRTNLQAWLGYPVRLREHRTARWRGFFVEPLLLWAVTVPQSPEDPYEIADELPVPNFSVLRSLAMGASTAVADDAARLDEELGLNLPAEERPDLDELIERLVAIRPDWDWRESIDPYARSVGAPLAEINKAGIHNRVAILSSKRSPYTRGLESELKSLSEAKERDVGETALGRWLCGRLAVPAKLDDQPLIEVLPMNTEQREAVHSALTAEHTVITGPPGTGKSQVVTNLLVNAAWRGMKVLFASKNNKAVDVVETRVNGLGNRPVLLRLGSREYQGKLVEYMTAMLSGRVSEDDRVSYEEGLARHEELLDKVAELECRQEATLAARNSVDGLEADVEDLREGFGDRFNDLDVDELRGIRSLGLELEHAIDRLDPGKHDLLGRIALKFGRAGRIAALQSVVARICAGAAQLGCEPAPSHDDLAAMREWRGHLVDRIAAALKVGKYQQQLERLRSCTSFEEIARQRQELTAEIADNSGRLWRDWVQLAPSRLTVRQRKYVADFAALLQVIIGQDGDRVNSTVKKQERALRETVSALFSCWAVTSLSARGKVPFVPGHFDLLIVDEASQCDIASVLPLLYRAKRTVIIGDPRQLRHISAVSRVKDSDLQAKHGLLENRAAWMYSVNSLYDLAAGVANAEQIINLRDHHRSHADIIEFSNRTFYEGRLRVATRYAQLKRPSNTQPGVEWQDVKGRVTRSSGSSAENETEANAVVGALTDLLITRGYQGSVGVVTPFRAQAERIRALVAATPGLSAVASRAELLIDTVHSFQGDERDVMLFSPVVSDGITAGALGFLRSNGNLFNVAITRARGLLHVVGDRSAALSSGVDYLAQFAAYVSRLTQERRETADEQMRPTGPTYPTVSRPERVSEWERILYGALYVAGVRAIPQYTVEQYDLDLAVILDNRRLDIEVDGERYHRSWTGELCLRDQLRNQRLIELGWEVKRFWVYEVRDRLPECVRWVKAWADTAAGR